MTTTAYLDIEVAFQTKLNGISGKPDIDYEGTKPYIPVLGTRYWRTTHFPANTRQVTADGLREHTGFYQVDIFAPSGKGLKVILNDMDSIASAYDTSTSITGNSQKVSIQGVTRTRVIQDDAWLFGSVKIQYLAYSY